MRVFIELSYDGAPFHGWQRQPHCLSVQEVLEEKLGLFVGQPVPVMGCGRTDTGVHASYFVAHADWPEDSPKAKRFKDWNEAAWKLNGMLPPSISIHRISEVAANAHARFDATERGTFTGCTPTRIRSSWGVLPASCAKRTLLPCKQRRSTWCSRVTLRPSAKPVRTTKPRCATCDLLSCGKTASSIRLKSALTGFAQHGTRHCRHPL